jgi:hypothetical protein
MRLVVYLILLVGIDGSVAAVVDSQWSHGGQVRPLDPMNQVTTSLNDNVGEHDVVAEVGGVRGVGVWAEEGSR